MKAGFQPLWRGKNGLVAGYTLYYLCTHFDELWGFGCPNNWSFYFRPTDRRVGKNFPSCNYFMCICGFHIFCKPPVVRFKRQKQMGMVSIGRQCLIEYHRFISELSSACTVQIAAFASHACGDRRNDFGCMGFTYSLIRPSGTFSRTKSGRRLNLLPSSVSSNGRRCPKGG
jgi:hypothetical protein